MNSFKGCFYVFFNFYYIYIVISSNSKPLNSVAGIINFSEGFIRNKNISITLKTSTRYKFMDSYNLKIYIINSYILTNWIFIFIKKFSLSSFSNYTNFSLKFYIFFIYEPASIIYFLCSNFCKLRKISINSIIV